MTYQYFFLILLLCLSTVVPLISAIEEASKCNKFGVSHYKYNKFYDLSLINGAQSENYFVQLPVTFESDHGDVHVVFSESTEATNTNRMYEFLLGGYHNTVFEIRRKNYLYEKRNFNGNRFADHAVPTNREFNVDFSISKSGVVQIESDEQFRFNLTDQLPVIPVKYVSFAGYRGAISNVTFDCVSVTDATTPSATEKLPQNMSTTTEHVDSVTPKNPTIDDQINQIV